MTLTSGFPERCIKGIPNKDFLDSEYGDPVVGSHLFRFDHPSNRQDGWLEESLNWEDNDSVVNFTLQQQKATGDRQFKAGVAVISRQGLEQMKQSGKFNQIFSYERRPVQGNPYHGNLLLAERTNTVRRKLAAAQLALHVLAIVPQPTP